MWPFEGNHYADVALGENEFDTPASRTQVSDSRPMGHIILCGQVKPEERNPLKKIIQ